MPNLETNANDTTDDVTFETLKTCIHEAAHVLAAREYGFEVAWVSIDPKFLNSDPLAVKSHIKGAVSSGISMVLSANVMNPILKRGYMISEEEQALVKGYCIGALAGPMAEEAFGQDPDMFACTADFAQVGLVTNKLFKDKTRRRQKIKLFEKEARSFVDENKDSILKLACDIFNNGTVMGSEIIRPAA